MNSEQALFAALKERLALSIVGQVRLLDHLLVGLLADGHVLVEGVPGLAKTMAVRALAAATRLSFSRIQFTPDLIPGDITGTDILSPSEGTFRFVPGPVFHELVLADEINRAPPKVQSALLEAMQEQQVTTGGSTRPLPAVFWVVATQNPLEHEGTFPLPEAQLDRFMLKINVTYPNADEELEMLNRAQHHTHAVQLASLVPLLSGEDVVSARAQVRDIYMDDMLARYIVALVNATREPAKWLGKGADWIDYGASPRATLALARSARALAYLQRRDFVEPGDIMAMTESVLQHRIGLSFAARSAGVNINEIIRRLVAAVPVP